MQANIRPGYHYLYVAPNLGAEWLFDAARNYVLTFAPIILADLDFVALTPPNTTVTVTAIARRDTAQQIGVELAQVHPYAYYDAIMRDTFEETKAELERRAAQNEPFGAPIGLPTASAPPGLIPTPIPTPSGPTLTPTPTLPVTPLPTSGDAIGPISGYARPGHWRRLMRLDEYQWSRNPRGMHVIGAFQTPVEFDRYTRPHMGWVKLLAATTDFVDDAVRFQELGITPIVRLYLGEWGAKPFDSHLQGITEAFIAAGVRWFEFYNEPNLGVEWPNGFNPDWRDADNVIRPLMDNWLSWAEYMISRGCYPGFIPLAEADTPDRSSVLWMDTFLNYLGLTHFQRFQTVLNNGMFVATHPYILNHYYQEVPGGGPLSARPPEQQRSDEPGWHFEYPYDPICQTNDPGRTVFGGTARTPYGDPVGLLAMGYMFNQRANELFGAQAVPVVGTEGGIWAFRGQSYQQDTRYPAYNEHSQGEATKALFDWISTSAPPWFFGLTLWKEDDYYSPNHAPAIDKLSASAPITKEVPPTEVLGPNAPSLSPLHPPGPGPIEGEPDNHLFLLAPGVDFSWFLDTAQAYWNTFRPMVSDRSELITLVPATQSLAVTVLALPDMENPMRASIEQAYPNVLFDLILATDKAAVAETLNNRVRAGERFGG